MNRKVAPPSKRALAGLGNRFAPPRFFLFGAVFVLASVALHFALSTAWSDAIVLGFNLAVPIFAIALWPLARGHSAAEMRRHAAENDANRGVVLVIATLVTLAMMLAMVAELPGAHSGNKAAIAKLVATLACGWLFSNLTFALHYAHMFYGAGNTAAKDAGGFDFPGTEEPDYWDFVYFSFTAGMSFAASDVDVTSGAVRRVVVLQCLLSFLFNIGALAFTINVLAGTAS